MVDPSNVKVLVACEESQAVCTAFRKRGFDAWSCDIVECSGGHPEWHFQQDCTPIVNSGKWDLVIAHPPCTYLCNSGNRHFNVETYGEKAVERMRRRDAGADFFMMFTRIPCDHWAIENPIGCMSTRFRKPDQVIQPYQFGHPTRKSTCLWLKGLPKLVPTNVVEPVTYTYVAKDGRIRTDCRERCSGKKADWARIRSRTFDGIAEAMADQWGRHILAAKNAGDGNHGAD